MTNVEIAKKAIKKARENGWIVTRPMLYDIPDPAFDHKATVRPWRYFPFMPGFAKAFWSELPESQYFEEPRWKYHLKQMVLEEDPIKYLEKFL